MKFPEFMNIYQMYRDHIEKEDDMDMYEKEFEEGMFDSFSKEEMDTLYTTLTHKEYAQDEDENHMHIIKQFDEEEMIAIEPLYINVGEVDAHGDGITDEELDKMIDDFNKNIDNIKGNIHHSFMTDGFKPIKAYRMPFTVYVGDPKKPSEMQKVPKGLPIVEVQFAKTEIGKQQWEERKKGELRGVSIGAKGRRVKNPNYKGNK